MLESDWIMRRVQEIASLVARVMRLAAGGQVALALDDLAAARPKLLPIDPTLIDSVDPASAAALLGPAFNVRTYGRLLALEADLHVQNGEAARATRLWTRALAMLDLAHAMPGPADAGADALAASVRERLARG